VAQRFSYTASATHDDTFGSCSRDKGCFVWVSIVLEELPELFEEYTVCRTVYFALIMTAPIQNYLFDSLRMELRRGCLILAVLAQLRVEHYGYMLRKALADDGLAIEESTLYPLLRRLETQGLLTSEWREEKKRNKRFYRVTADGEIILAQLLAEWSGINESLHRISRDRNEDGKSTTKLVAQD
jgi:PadR family transcriptional regulator, regulatory protein PadR